MESSGIMRKVLGITTQGLGMVSGRIMRQGLGMEGGG